MSYQDSSGAGGIAVPTIPCLFTSPPPIKDNLPTESSVLQDATVKECLPFLTNSSNFHAHVNTHGVPHLDRSRHVAFLHKQLGKLPPQFKAADPSRPWFFYWCLAALAVLGEDVEDYRSRLVGTVRPMQNQGGGFAGGFGQMSHLATTYATVLALVLVGGEDAYETVDRRAMWRWLSSLKQPDGGFQMAVGGEEDVRGAYCAAVIISLLNLPLDLAPDSPARASGHTRLFDGLAEWVRRCQTYEGGISAKPGVEAHGAYAFCALGCLSILDSPTRSFAKYLDVPKLMSWLSSRQDAPAAGFSGRTNKLVDGCYSHWVGGCWPLIEASLNAARGGSSPPPPEKQQPTPTAGRPSAATSTAALFSRDGLIRYILCCCQDQSKRGGLRDKPSKISDAYHTCYVLSGLSSAQHKWDLVTTRADGGILDTDEWAASPFSEGKQIFDEEDRVKPVHPVYVIPKDKAEAARQYFMMKTGF
ncbi:hypothetical protein NLU13_7797 [Sarocladium strictum]|uniref:Protein farnesyltransferase subunit beta n=1 Tax=Sarocladium strictum TaxID=5046 RepID=A0AA39L5J3_SARSR|nr:hypothetical protein NLU13_7797 [Sarocladium strictum]